jgi:dTDP-4-amino-4,6-dideoxygalactose transaminase
MKGRIIMIPFNKPAFIGDEMINIRKAIDNNHLSGDGSFTKQCSEWFKDKLKAYHTLLTTSCTHALEMAAILADIQPGDEVIMPSYTFVSTANAFVLRGAKIIFIDIDKDTMNLDTDLIVHAITKKTKAIVPVHYAGVSCDMDIIIQIAKKYNLTVIEDAAQGINGFYKDRPLGTIGHLGCISFHETKNVNCGEGGALIINDPVYRERAEIIREKGTNRSKYFRGEVDKYSWVDIGSSYLMSEINAAFLYAQLLNVELITESRLRNWNTYYKLLGKLAEEKRIMLPVIPKECKHNGHMFYIKVKDLEERSAMISYLKDRNVYSVFHYVPLHSSVAGMKYGAFQGADAYTTIESERIIRLPLFYGLEEEDVRYITSCVYKFYESFCEV